MKLAVTLRVAHNHDAMFNDIAPSIKHPHVTIGFISNVLGYESLHRLQKETECVYLNFIQKNKHLIFKANFAQNAFGNSTVLVPSKESAIKFHELNTILAEHMVKLDVQMDLHTLPENYTPHLTIKRRLSAEAELETLNTFIHNAKKKNQVDVECSILRFVVLE